MLEGNDTQYIDISMQTVADYITNKYWFKTVVTEDDSVYVLFEAGRLIILYEELLYFIDNNQEFCDHRSWTDLIDIYLVHCLTTVLNEYTESAGHNSNLILQ